MKRYRVSSHPYLFDAMFAGPWPRKWLGAGAVQVYQMAGAVNSVTALVSADAKGRVALERAGFQLEAAGTADRLRAAAGGRVITR